MKLAASLRTALVALPALACVPTQRVAAPIWLDDEASREEPSLGAAPGPSATVVRHVGPVWIQREGAPAGYPLAFYDKRARLEAGGTVLVGRDGRAELLWSGAATSVVVLGRGEVEVGDTRADVAVARFVHLTRAQLLLDRSDRVALPGGAELRGDVTAATGPFLVEHRDERTLRVENQAKLSGAVLFRGVELALAPGDAIELPLLEEGVPAPPPPGLGFLAVGDYVVESTGRIEAALEGDRLRVRAIDPTVVVVGGIRVHLAAGEEVRFSKGSGQTAAGAPRPGAES